MLMQNAIAKTIQKPREASARLKVCISAFSVSDFSFVRQLGRRRAGYEISGQTKEKGEGYDRNEQGPSHKPEERLFLPN